MLDNIAESNIMNIARSNTSGERKGGEKLNAIQIGKNLRKLRGDRTIQEVSDATGLGWSTICSYELGNRIPEDRNKVILAKYYNSTVQELFFDEDIAGSDSAKSNNED